ncbi:MAG: ExbD/TolR family protein [Alphaproteobacteria bacterium]
MISLIDIMFMLILFFMIAGHLEKVAIIEIALPLADSGQTMDEGPIEVMLGRYDEILINEELQDVNSVLATLKTQLAVNPDRVITIKADALLEANKLVDFMQAVRDAGGRNLSLVTATTGAK